MRTGMERLSLKSGDEFAVLKGTFDSKKEYDAFMKDAEMIIKDCEGSDFLDVYDLKGIFHNIEIHNEIMKGAVKSYAKNNGIKNVKYTYGYSLTEDEIPLLYGAFYELVKLYAKNRKEK